MEKRIPSILSADISTTCTAICILDATNGKLLKMYHEVLNKTVNKKPKFPTFWSKVNHMESVFDLNHEDIWDVKIIAVEESAKRFPSNMSSAGTIITLSKFNAVLSFILFQKYGVEPTDINVRTARKQLGIKIDYKDKSKSTKQKVLEQVIDMRPEFPWIYREVQGEKKLLKINEDRADAFVIGAAAKKMIYDSKKKKN